VVFPKPLNPKPFTCTVTLGFADRERLVSYLVKTILGKGVTPRELKDYYTKGVPVNCMMVSRCLCLFFPAGLQTSLGRGSHLVLSGPVTISLRKQ